MVLLTYPLSKFQGKGINMKSVCLCFLIVVVAYANWTVEIVDSEGTDTGVDCSITLLDNNYPAISYRSAGAVPSSLKCAYWTGSSWTIDVPDSPVEAYSTSICSNGTSMQIAYRDDFEDDLLYANWNGSSWDVSPVDTLGSVGMYASMCLDSNDYPHIAYYDGLNGCLKYAVFNGTDWSISTFEESGANTAKPEFVLDGNDIPHIVYLSQPTYNIVYLTYTADGWQSEVVDTGSSSSGVSIEVDSNDNPHLAYINSYDDDKNLMYTHWNNSEWVYDTIVADEYGLFNNVSLALNSLNEPSILYFIQVPSSSLRYAYWSNGWYDEEIDTEYHTSRSHVIDSNDCPHVVYDDNNSGLLKYAHSTTVGSGNSYDYVIDNSPLSLSCNPFNDILVISSTSEQIASELSVHDATGRKLVELYPNQEGSFVWNGNNEAGHEVSRGLYFVRAIVGQTAICRPVVKL